MPYQRRGNVGDCEKMEVVRKIEKIPGRQIYPFLWFPTLSTSAFISGVADVGPPASRVV
jgi:hypothetical protein